MDLFKKCKKKLETVWKVVKRTRIRIKTIALFEHNLEFLTYEAKNHLNIQTYFSWVCDSSCAGVILSITCGFTTTKPIFSTNFGSHRDVINPTLFLNSCSRMWVMQSGLPYPITAFVAISFVLPLELVSKFNKTDFHISLLGNWNFKSRKMFLQRKNEWNRRKRKVSVQI